MSAVDSSRMKLILGSVCIKRGGFDAWSSFLQNPNSKLAVLDLGEDDIDDEGANALARGLSRNSTLQELYLSGNDEITEAGWRAIFTALQNNPSCRLEKLSLNGNDSINDTAALSLSQL